MIYALFYIFVNLFLFLFYFIFPSKNKYDFLNNFFILIMMIYCIISLKSDYFSFVMYISHTVLEGAFQDRCSTQV